MMQNTKKLFPGGRRKAFTLSYDDGICQDKRLVALFNKYGLKATFNLNSGLQNEKFDWTGAKGIQIKHINMDEIVDLYKGHEAAVHSLTHPFLQDLPEEQIFYELSEDKKNLEALFGYPVRGMAYPYGTYDAAVKAVAAKVGIKYSRTVEQHYTFEFPKDYLEWHTTCHHASDKLMELAHIFAESQNDALELFYVWGHSYEFDEQDNWDMMEEFCSFMSNREDIWYATNIEVFEHMNAAD